MTVVNIVMWETRHSTADSVYSKTQILLATLRTRNQPQLVSCVFLEVELFSSQLDVQETNFSFAHLYRV